VSLWLLLVVGFVIGGVLIAVGVHMLKPAWSDQGTRADVGVAVITTTAISLAIFALQILDENRLERDDANRQEESADQALRLQLGLSTALRGMDLSGKDLHGINLPQKHLEGADFSNADLSGANFEGAFLNGASFNGAELAGVDLKGARLVKADLRNADLGGEAQLDYANLTNAKLQGAELPSASLYGSVFDGVHASGANLDDAVVTQDWKVEGMEYDSKTVFPNGKRYPCCRAPCILPPTAESSRCKQR
jgi:uncharacterized protein YjbI with pentapeptide repeats